MKFPTDPDAELGAVARVIEDAGQGAQLLTLDLFGTDDGIALAEALQGLVEERTPVSAVAIGRRCSMGLVSRAMGAAGPGLNYVLPILREKRALRALQARAAILASKVQELNGERRAIVNDLRATIGEATTELMAMARGLDDGQRRGMRENLLDVITALEAADRGERPPAIPTGLPTLDRVLCGGLRMGEMTVLGARTSVGKSAMACWIAKSACASGKSVLYASREMQCCELTARLLSAEADAAVRTHDGQKHLPQRTQSAIVGAAARMRDWKLVIRDDLKCIGAVCAEASAIKPDLVVIDHIGIYDAGLGPRSSSYDRATANSNYARDLAFDTGAAVLALAQVNRAGAGEDKPRLEHLKSTGALEEDARAVLLLHRLEELNGEIQTLELNLAKNTYGPLRCVKLRFDAARCNFAEENDIDPDA